VLRRLVAFLLGYLRVEVTRGSLERFLNLTLTEGITLWQIERQPDRMLATLTLADFRRLRPVARGARSRVHIRRRHGLPFLRARLASRPVLVTGAVACLGFVLWASGHVWVVRVKVSGPGILDPRAVRAVAAEAGLRPGASKHGLDSARIQAHIERRMSEVSWAVIRIQGTRAVVEVVEKAAVRPPSAAACVNLVARKSGVVEQVIPFQGEPVVRVGDVVSAGDLLVECSLKYWAGGRPQVYPGTPLPPREAVARNLMAQGLIRARIAYQEYREVPLVREVQVPTGRTAVRWVLAWQEKPILVIRRGATFSRAVERQQTVGRVAWRNWRSPVELTLVHLDEVRVEREPIALDKAVSNAKGEMMARLHWVLGPSDRILTPLQVDLIDKGKETAGIRLTVETLEEIAMPREGTPAPPPPTPSP